MKKFIVILTAFIFFGFVPDAPVRIFLVGDSTMSDKPLIDNPEHGWGQMLPIFFSENAAIFNYAKNGRSTRSFLFEGRWNAVMNNLRAGDFVFIQFGHNDSKKEDTSRFAAPQTDYKNNLLRFVREARSKNAVPILLTPVNRRNYDAKGRFVDKHGEYPGVVREIAKSENVPLIDLHKKSKLLFEKLGAEESKKYFLLSVPPNVYRALPAGKDDNTHFTRFGATEIAKLVVEGIVETGLSLKNEIISTNPKLQCGGVVVGLDEFYNNEWKTGKDGKKFRHHYIWDDTTDGGFSELAKIFDRYGADTDTLQTAPTIESLKRFSAYIIVDPDTPKETENPNYMNAADADVIEQWVKDGGALVLLTNDSTNSDFDNINILAERFGMHFNGDAQHYFRELKDYKIGWSSNLPNHPLFKNLDGLFIKQVSSISVKAPAVSILTENGLSLMAEARVGKGVVLAVGDPWLYNEYIDARRLPKGFENSASAKKYAEWICVNAKKVR